MRTMQRVRGVMVGVVSMVTLAGYDGDEPSSSSLSATTTVAPATTTTISQVQLDKEKALRVVLTAADLPGFTADPPDADDAGAASGAGECMGDNPVLYQLGEASDPRGATSNDFSKGAVTVRSDVTFAESDDVARAAVATLTTASFPACYSEILTSVLNEESNITNVSVTTTRLPTLNVGDQAVGFRATSKLRFNGMPITVYADSIFIRSGRGFTILELTSTPAPFPDAERLRLATTLAERMAA